MNKILRWGIFILAVMTLASCATSKQTADKYTAQWRYEVEPVSIGTQGSYLIKVWSYSKKQAVAAEQAKKNAVHGVVFRGFAGMNGVSRKAPLASPNLENEKREFFVPFFADGGRYMKYVSITNDGSIGAKDRLKVGKEYKIGVVVAVAVDELRKDLEDAGIIRPLGAGFAPR